ncbi:MAG: response regulator transcription factor [Chloroflexi bacterium]|nr:response regulator transcription factor [Chloroflexota bacterium]
MMATRILLADDHDLVRVGIRNALQDQPNLEIVGEVGDGATLHPALAQSQPDLLIIDVNMPHFDPIRAIRQIRQQYPHLRVLVVSAHDDDVYVQGLLREGVNGYHLKDQPLSDLRLAVAHVLAGKRWISSPLLDKLIQPDRGGSTAETVSGSASKLSTRQLEILHLLAEGLDNRAMASQLGLSVKTIETHLTRLYRHINVQSRLEAAHYAHEHPELQAAQSSRTPVVDNRPALVVQAPPATLLVVDDNVRYRQQVRRMIGRIYPQAKVYEAADTEEALLLVRQVAPQLTFIDVVLGDENGIRCAQQIRTLVRHARIVLMSAYPDREFHRLGLQAGASAFIDKKELDTETLYQIIMDALG